MRVESFQSFISQFNHHKTLFHYYCYNSCRFITESKSGKIFHAIIKITFSPVVVKLGKLFSKCLTILIIWDTFQALLFGYAAIYTGYLFKR